MLHFYQQCMSVPISLYLQQHLLFTIFLITAILVGTKQYLIVVLTYICLMRSVLGVRWKDRCWSWNSNTLATWCEELTHWKRPWCWEGLGAGGEGDNRGGDGWMASATRWTWVWVNSGSWWWTRRPGVPRFMGSHRVRHDWATELNWMTNDAEHLFMCLFIYLLWRNIYSSPWPTSGVVCLLLLNCESSLLF